MPVINSTTRPSANATYVSPGRWNVPGGTNTGKPVPLPPRGNTVATPQTGANANPAGQGNPQGEPPPSYPDNKAPQPITPILAPTYTDAGGNTKPQFQNYTGNYPGIAPGGPPGNPPGPVIDSSQLQDAGGAVNTQWQANILTAQANANLNRIGQSNDYGSLQYAIDPATGKVVQKESLSDPQQQILQGQQGQEIARNNLGTQELGNISKTVSQPLDFSGAAPIPGADAGTRDKVSRSLYDSQMKLIQPRQDQERKDFTKSLADKGIPEGSELYNNQLLQFNNRQDQERQQVANQATQAGGAEQERLFNIGKEAHTVGTGDILTQRNQPINEYGALQGLNKGVSQPNFTNVPQVNQAGVDVTGTGQGYLGLANQRYGTDVNDAQARALGNLNSQTQQFQTAVGANTSRYQSDVAHQQAKDVANITGNFGNQQTQIQGKNAANVADITGRYNVAGDTVLSQGKIGDTIIKFGGAAETGGGTPPKNNTSGLSKKTGYIPPRRPSNLTKKNLLLGARR